MIGIEIKKGKEEEMMVMIDPTPHKGEGINRIEWKTHNNNNNKTNLHLRIFILAPA